jgi:hypothetical protein
MSTTSKASKHSKLKINTSSEADMKGVKQDAMPLNESDIKMGTIS